MDALAFHVLSLIIGLGDSSFQVRQEASKNLAALGAFAHVPLARAKLYDPDPEVRMRARVILEDWRSSFRPTKSAVDPWLDCLPNDYPGKQQIVTRILFSIRGEWGYDYDQDTSDWPVYRQATTVFVDELIAAGKSRKEITQLLDQMAEQEAKYWRQRNGEAEPIPVPNN